MEYNYECRKCKNGYFSISYDSGFTTPCGNCNFTDLEKRVELYGKPEYIEFPKGYPREPEPRPHIEDIIDRAIKSVISKFEIPESLSSKDLEDLVKNACFYYVCNEGQSTRKIVFSWVDGLNIDDQHEFIVLGLSVAKTCKSYVSGYLETLDNSRYWQKSPQEIRDEHYKFSRCEYCCGSKCRWCNYTGVSWTYWMRRGQFSKNKSSIRGLLVKKPSEFD